MNICNLKNPYAMSDKGLLGAGHSGNNKTEAGFKLEKAEHNFNLKIGGLASMAFADGSNLTVYKSDTYMRENPMLRVVTSKADGSETEQIINPGEIDIADATAEEMFALNAYLVDCGRLDDGIYQTSIMQAEGVSDTRKNFVDIVKEMMTMQYNARNLSGYAEYSKILGVYNTFMEESNAF